MKSIFCLIGLNTFVLAFLLFGSSINSYSTEIRSWDDDWVPCDWVQEDNYYEHECRQGTKYVSCMDQSCVGQPGFPID